MPKTKTIWDVADAQGWTSKTVLLLALDFIHDIAASDDVFVEYAQARADQENREASIGRSEPAGPPPTDEDREAQAAYDDLWERRRS